MRLYFWERRRAHAPSAHLGVRTGRPPPKNQGGTKRPRALDGRVAASTARRVVVGGRGLLRVISRDAVRLRGSSLAGFDSLGTCRHDRAAVSYLRPILGARHTPEIAPIGSARFGRCAARYKTPSLAPPIFSRNSSDQELSRKLPGSSAIEVLRSQSTSARLYIRGACAGGLV